MPVALIYLGIAGGVGALAGFVAGKGTSGVGNTIKYTVLGAGAIIVAKQLKVI